MRTYRFDEVGEKCRECREALGISQRTVARETSVSQAAVSLFESGRIMSGKLLIWYIKKGVQL